MVFWSEFKGRAQEFRSNLDHDFLSKTMDKLPPPVRGAHETGPEYMLLSKFLSLAGDIHNYIMDLPVDMNESSICGIELGTGLRVPDFVCTLKSEKDANGLRKPIAPIIVGEVKRKNIVNYGTSLEQLYETRAEVRDAIWQLAGYHVQFKCEFGILTTYKYTWASRLDSNGTLLLSPAYDSDQGGLDTTMNLLHYLSTIAAEKWKLGGWTAPVFLQVVPNGKNSPESANEFEVDNYDDFSLSLLDESSFNLVRVMNSHEDRVTWQAVDDKESFYVIKGFESEGDRNLEVRCYEALSELQGSCIPVLVNKTFTLKSDKVRKYALVLSWIGADEGNNYMTLPTHVLLRARDLVLKMHALGVVHGDLRPENMNFDFKTNQLYIFDFSDAKLKAEMSAAAFKQACLEELESLDRQIEWSRSSSASQIVYSY